MKKEKDGQAGELIARIAELYGWKERLDEEKAKTVFKNLLDESTAKSIMQVSVRNRILYVRINNAAARSNLAYRTSTLVQQINSVLAYPFIEAIHFV